MKSKEKEHLIKTVSIIFIIIVLGYFFLHYISISRLAVAEYVINSTIKQADYVNYDLSLGIDPEHLLKIYEQDLKTLDEIEELIISAEKLDPLEQILYPHSTDYLHIKLANARLRIKTSRFIVLKFIVAEG